MKATDYSTLSYRQNDVRIKSFDSFVWKENVWYIAFSSSLEDDCLAVNLCYRLCRSHCIQYFHGVWRGKSEKVKQETKEEKLFLSVCL